jgi:cobalt-zinc-cadmium efflux system protein
MAGTIITFVAHAHHHHGHGVTIATGRDRRILGAALALILLLLAGEVVAGLLAHSLALLADAGHLLTDAAALGMAVGAAVMAERPPRGEWTWGFRRLEVLAAQVNGATLLVLGVWIVYSAIRRLISPQEVHGGIVVAVALAGIAVNIAATALLARASRESINVRGAFLHVATDLAAFVGTAIAGLAVLLTGWNRFDPIASLLVAALMFWAAFGLLRDSSRILLELAPRELDPGEVGRTIAGIPDVVEAHDLHVWTVTSGFPALSAHVLVRPEADCHAVRRTIEADLHDRFGLDHTTLQVDHAPPATVALRKLGGHGAPRG